MATRPVTTISDIPREIIDIVASLTGRSLPAFRKTCRAYRDISARHFEALKNQLFVDRYGALTESEKNTPFEILIRRAKSFPVLDAQSGIVSARSGIDPLGKILRNRPYNQDPYPPQDLWLEIDAEGVPRLSNYQVLFRRTMPALERLRTEYRFYRREFHQVRDTQLLSLLSHQNTIDLELVQQPLNSNSPLQDLKERMHRSQTLYIQRTSLLCAMDRSRRCYQTFLGNLGIIKKVLFFVISYFHSFYQKPYTGEIQGSSLPPSFRTLNNRGVPMGETKITFRGAEIPVVIEADFGTSGIGVNFPYDFDGTTRFSIFRKTNLNSTVPSFLGSIQIGRMWSRTRPDGTYKPYCSEGANNVSVPGKDVGTLQNRRLFSNLLHDDLGQDSMNGDRPIIRLLTQIALEVFQVEPDKRLEISSNHYAVFIAGGGGFSHQASTFDVKIKEEIQKAREANRLFPDYRDLASFTVYIEKSSSHALTRFVTKNEEKVEQPALVDFRLNHPPITWEEQIRRHPLLSLKNGPILPKFFIHDLSRYEKPPEKLIEKKAGSNIPTIPLLKLLTLSK